MYDITSPTNSGRVIAVWSPINKQGATSTTAALLASYASRINKDDKVLIISYDTTGSPTASYYLTKDNKINGLAEVIELAMSDNLRSPEDLYNNAFSIASNIDALTCDKGNTNVADYLYRYIDGILKLARKSYKYVIVDTVNGLYDLSTTEILKSTDCLVVGLPQDKYVFDSWVRKMPTIYPYRINNDKTVVLCSIYYDYDHMKYQAMRREMKGKPLYYINQNSLVHEAVSNRNMLDMMISEIKKQKMHDVVVDEIGAIYNRVETILSKVIEEELEIEEKEASRVQEDNIEHLKDTAGEDFFSDMGYGDEPEDIPEDISTGESDYQDYGEFSEQNIGDSDFYSSSSSSSESSSEPESDEQSKISLDKEDSEQLEQNDIYDADLYKDAES